MYKNGRSNVNFRFFEDANLLHLANICEWESTITSVEEILDLPNRDAGRFAIHSFHSEYINLREEIANSRGDEVGNG
jgi:hypothetical protein